MPETGLDQVLRHRSKSLCHTDTTRRLITRTIPAHLPLDKTPDQLDGIQVIEDDRSGEYGGRYNTRQPAPVARRSMLPPL